MSSELSDNSVPSTAERDGHTRREVLKRGGGAALSLGAGSGLLAACGSSSSGSAAAASSGSSSNIGVLNWMSWQGYDIPPKSVPAIGPWERAHHLQLKTTYISSNEDVVAKIESGGGAGLDIITYGQQNAALYHELGFLRPIDSSKLPNLKNLYSLFQGNFKNFWVLPDGTRTGVPAYWGVGALNYNSAVIPTPPDTYNIILDPKYNGKVVSYDSVNDVLGQVAIALGIDYSRMTQADFAKVTDWAKRMLRQTRGLAVSLGDMATRLANGDAVLGFPGYGLINAYAAAAGNKTIKFAVPKEGSFAYVDSWAIPTGATNVEGAYAWINETMDPKVSGQGANYLDDGTVCVPSAVPHLTPDVKAFYPYDNLGPYLAKATFGLNPPPKSSKYVTLAQVAEAWQTLKAEA